MSDTKYLFESLGIPIEWLGVLLILVAILQLIIIINNSNFRRYLKQQNNILLEHYRNLSVRLNLDPDALIKIIEEARREQSKRLEQEASKARRIADELTAKADDSKRISSGRNLRGSN